MKRTLSVALVSAAALAGAGFVVVAGTPPVASAQEAESFQTKYEKKVAEAWFKDNGFTDDYDKAKDLAAKTGKPIFAYFTRSYAG
jgi:hypothetical protein